MTSSTGCKVEFRLYLLEKFYNLCVGKKSRIDIACYNRPLTQYCEGDKIEKNEMGGACGTYGGGEKYAQGFGGET